MIPWPSSGMRSKRWGPARARSAASGRAERHPTGVPLEASSRDTIEDPLPPQEAALDMPADDPRPTDPGLGGTSRVARRVYAAFVTLGVIVGALAGVLALSHDIRGLFTSDTPAAIDARIERVVRTRSRMPFGEYLADTKLPRSGFSREQLAQPGYEFTVTVTITGRVGKTLPLWWRMFRKPETPLPAPIYDREAVGFEPKSKTHSDSWPVWVPYPPTAGNYFVRFILRDPDGLPASQRDSGRFGYSPS
jgi:hypothetical protein